MHFTVIALSVQAFYGRKPQGLNGALQEVGITFEGREHSGNVCISLYVLSFYYSAPCCCSYILLCVLLKKMFAMYALFQLTILVNRAVCIVCCGCVTLMFMWLTLDSCKQCRIATDLQCSGFDNSHTEKCLYYNSYRYL